MSLADLPLPHRERPSRALPDASSPPNPIEAATDDALPSRSSRPTSRMRRRRRASTRTGTASDRARCRRPSGPRTGTLRPAAEHHGEHDHGRPSRAACTALRRTECMTAAATITGPAARTWPSGSRASVSGYPPSGSGHQTRRVVVASPSSPRSHLDAAAAPSRAAAGPASPASQRSGWRGCCPRTRTRGHRQRTRRTGFDAQPAEDAAQIVDLVDAAVALARGEALVLGVGRALDVDRVGGAGPGAQLATDALLEAVGLPVQLVTAVEPRHSRLRS